MNKQDTKNGTDAARRLMDGHADSELLAELSGWENVAELIGKIREQVVKQTGLQTGEAQHCIVLVLRERRAVRSELNHDRPQQARP